MKYEEIIALHQALRELNCDQHFPTLEQIKVRPLSTKSTRRVRRRHLNYLRNLTPEIITARISEWQDSIRPLPAGARPVPSNYKWGMQAARYIADFSGIKISTT